jgi:hypothetical protein
MCTKQLLSSLSSYFGSTEMLGYSYPFSALLLLDLHIDTDFIPAIRFLVEPLPEFGTFAISKDTSSVVIMSSQITSYVACK